MTARAVFVCVLASGPASRASVATLAKIYAPKALPVPSIRAGRSCPRWISPGSGAGPAHAGALQSFQGTPEARSGHRRPQAGPELPPVSLPGTVAGRVQEQRQRAR